MKIEEQTKDLKSEPLRIKDHQISQLINNVTNEVKPFTDCESIRERIAGPIREFFTPPTLP